MSTALRNEVGMRTDITRKLPLEDILGSKKHGGQLKRSLGAFELTMMGVGVISAPEYLLLLAWQQQNMQGRG